VVLDSKALDGRTVLLTGASGGIGAATAGTLAAAGATVLAHYRSDRAQAELALADIPEQRKWFLPGDLGSPDGARAVWRAAEEHQRVDILVLNAAVMAHSPMDGPDADWDAGWDDALRVNVIGAGTLMRAAIRTFAARGGGTVIAISSWAAEQGSRILDASAYAASKAALRNLAQTCARHYARDGVRVHIVAPGVVRSGMGTAGLDDDQLSQVADGLAMGRHVDAIEVAELVAFLATDAAPSLTGGTIDLNGASYLR